MRFDRSPRGFPLGAISEFRPPGRLDINGVFTQWSCAMLMRTTVQNAAKQVPARGSQTVPGSPPLAGAIDMMGAPMAFARNSEIFGEGEPADYLYKVVSGTVRTSKILADGRRQIGSFHLAGDVFGLEVGDEHAFSAEAIT